MKHFGAAEWIDFVNGVVEPAHKTAMQKHLGERCQVCEAEVARWGRIRQVTAREKDYQPPKEIVHMAKAAYSASGWARDRKAGKGVVELLFDSFRQPLVAGVRSVGSAPRRMLYAADDLKIDLQVEPQAEGQTIIVTGQLLDSRQPGAVVRDMKVTLSNGRGRTIEARTNEFGEFREEIEDGGDLHLTLPGSSGEPLVISLPDILGRS
jgi:hypothetical protein